MSSSSPSLSPSSSQPHPSSQPSSLSSSTPSRTARIAAGVAAGGALAAATAVAGAGVALLRVALDADCPHSIFVRRSGNHFDDHGATNIPVPEQTQRWFEMTRQSVVIRSYDRLRLHSWRFDPDTARPLPHCYAVCVHGYTGGPEEMTPWAQHYAAMGFTVLTPALRAHERSEGRYVTMGALERRDLKQWVNLIISRDPQARILLHGNSMGGASVLLAGADPCHAPNVKAIVADSAFVCASTQLTGSMADALHVPRALARLSVGVANLLLGRVADASLADADVLDAVRRLTLPTLFIQGGTDTIVDPSSARRLYEACASNDCELLVVPDAGHVASLAADPALYWSTVDAFLRRIPAFADAADGTTKTTVKTAVNTNTAA